MAEQNDNNGQTPNRPDTRRYEAQDDEGHIKGSRQEGSSHENMKEQREADANDQSELNKQDDRGTMSGTESV